MNTYRSCALLALVLIAMAGCSTHRVAGRDAVRVAVPAASSAAGVESAAATEPPRELVWYRTSAEMKAAYSQAYRIAREKLPALATGHAPGTWAVIMDADETILDNSESLLRSALEHPAHPHEFSDDGWNRWAREARAPALPGAKQFVDRVHVLGGKVVVVTNRDDVVCEPTRRNLQSLGIVVEGVLCATDATGNKNPRFASVRDGTSPLKLPPLTVVAYVGDNIQDFPGRLQANPGSLDDFGESLFILPNPLYGSWDHNVLH